jgi:putative ABC transport system substrate-binding protein
MPVVGFMHPTSYDAIAHQVAGFRRGLRETGFTEGQNVKVEYLWAEGQYDRLPGLAAELVRRRVAVIAAVGGDHSAFAAQAATTTIPIVINASSDPVTRGLIASLARPGGNITGISQLSVGLLPKRLELLCEVAPTAAVIAVLVNPTSPTVGNIVSELEPATRALRRQLEVLRASDDREIEAVFASLAGSPARALLIANDPLFNARSEQIGALALRHAVPTIYQLREFVAAGGLMSYGASFVESYRQVGTYTGRILKGARPEDLPVEQLSRVDFVINLKTARALGVNIPLALLARADEVIE